MYKLSIDSISYTRLYVPSLQLRDLLTRTVESYVTLYDVSNTTRLPVFKLQLCLEEGDMQVTHTHVKYCNS